MVDTPSNWLNHIRHKLGQWLLGSDTPLTQTNTPADIQARLPYTSLFEQSNDAIFLLNLDAVHIAVNQQATEMTGYTRDELVGASYRILVDEKEYDHAETMLDRILSGEKIPRYERTFHHRDGHAIYTEVSVTCIYDESGQPVCIQSIVRDITESRQAKQALRQQKENYCNAVEASLDAFYLMESVRDENGEITDFRIVEINENAVQQMNMPREVLLGGLICEMFPINRENGFFDRYKRVAETGIPSETEYQIPKGYTAPGWYHQQVVKVNDGVSITNRDISSRKQVEEKLRQSEERLQTIIENIPIMISFFDENGNFLYTNQHWLDRLGWTGDELNRMEDSLSAFYPDPEYRQQALDFMLSAEPGWRDFRTHTKHNGVIDTTWANVRLSDGQSIGIGQDISKRKQMEKDLRQSKARLQALFSALPDLIFRHHRDGTFLDYHATDESNLYLPPEDFIDQKIEKAMPSEIAQQHMEMSKKTLDTRQQQIYEYELPLDGEPRHYEARMVASGEDEVLSIVRDITELWRAQQREFEFTLEKERRRLLADFIETAAHEFRTPLTTIATSTYVMSRTTDTEHRKLKAHHVEVQIQRLTKLVNMLLLTTRVENDDDIHKETVNLGRLMGVLCRQIPRECREKYTIDCQVNDDIPRIPGNVEYLDAAFTQLLDNACRYTNDGGTITITNGLTDDHLWVNIHNTGPHIPESDLPHIFKTFWRQDTAHTTPGFGLGLPIAKKIIEQHGGTIEIRNSSDKGVSFHAVFPVPSGDE